MRSRFIKDFAVLNFLEVFYNVIHDNDLIRSEHVVNSY
jgi:hypothetical protein